MTIHQKNTLKSKFNFQYSKAKSNAECNRGVQHLDLQFRNEQQFILKTTLLSAKPEVKIKRQRMKKAEEVLSFPWTDFSALGNSTASTGEFLVNSMYTEDTSVNPPSDCIYANSNNAPGGNQQESQHRKKRNTYREGINLHDDRHWCRSRPGTAAIVGVLTVIILVAAIIIIVFCILGVEKPSVKLPPIRSLEGKTSNFFPLRLRVFGLCVCGCVCVYVCV